MTDLQQALHLHRQGQLSEAERRYAGILQQRPDHFVALHMLGVVALQTGRANRAVELIRRAIALNGGVAAAHCNLGHALRQLGRQGEAAASYADAARLQDDLAEAHASLGLTLRLLQRFDEAIISCDKAIALQPGYAETHSHRGDALLELQRYPDAVASYDRVIALRPDVADAHINRATALHGLGRHDEAMAGYAAAIALAPMLPEAHVTRALWRLKLGDFAEGWPEHEWRWRTAQFADSVRNFAQPLWLGDSDPAGKTILLHAEQGLGDTIQFCRYARLVAARGAQVVLEVQPPLVRLMASLGVGTVVAAGETLPPFDLHCPLMSLPLAFGTTSGDIPAAEAYLAAEPASVAAWRRRLAPLPGLRVGLAWAGNPAATAIDSRRSMALEMLAPLAAVPQVSLVSLQKGEAATHARGFPVQDYTDELTDFADTAALIAALDLVISVDTAVAHLAGALGKPVWILHRFDSCWRWLLQRSDSPWYPSARLFRQPAPGDWTSVVREVREGLHDVAIAGAR